MDPLSLIITALIVLGFCVAGLFARHHLNSAKLTAHDLQIKRLVADAESEKGTRRRINHDLENRLRLLEGRPSLPPLHDDSSPQD